MPDPSHAAPAPAAGEDREDNGSGRRLNARAQWPSCARLANMIARAATAAPSPTPAWRGWRTGRRSRAVAELRQAGEHVSRPDAHAEAGGYGPARTARPVG